MIEIKMPSLGESVIECTVIGILKKAGDTVEADESILEVATDKVDTEVPCPVSGVIAEILVRTGDSLPIGGVILKVTTEAESTLPSSATPTAVVAQLEDVEVATAPITSLTESILPKSTPVITSNGTRFYSPLVQTIARTEGISQAELDVLTGTGADNRVTKYDILNYVANRSQATAISPKTKVASQTSNGSAIIHHTSNEVIPFDRMRKVIAERMIESQRISAHVSSYVECDVTAMVQWREAVKQDFRKKTGEGLTFTPLLIEAVARAIKDFPRINASVEGDALHIKPNINVGMAVATENGNLIVPVVHNADQLNLVQLSQKVNDLANRGRQNKLMPDDLAGGTYTISNIGTFDNLMGTPIIVQPQIAIMAFGAIKKRPVVIETPQGDVIGIRSMMYLSHSFDHRVVDGALGGMFVKRVAQYLSNFDSTRRDF